MASPEKEITEKQETKSTYPYVSFRTVLNLLDRFRTEGGVPSRLDRGVLSGSEGGKTQLLAALRTLGLINLAGEPSTEFATLAMNEQGRPALLATILKRHYGKQVALGSKNATPKQLQETFDGVSDDTRRKAVAFYLHAAKYAGLPLSLYFKTPRVGRPMGSTTRKRKPKGHSNQKNGAHEAVAASGEDANRQRYIDLLMKRIEEGGQLDPELLNRIEGLLGYRKP